MKRTIVLALALSACSQPPQPVARDQYDDVIDRMAENRVAGAAQASRNIDQAMTTSRLAAIEQRVKNLERKEVLRGMQEASPKPHWPD